MHGRKSIFITLLFSAISFCCFLNTHAQVKFYTVVTEQSISSNPSFQVQYIVEGTKNIKQFNVPGYQDFRVDEVFDLPNSSVLNSKTLKLADAYSKIVILTPLKKGKLSIEGATAIINGNIMRSNSIKVMVTQSGLAALKEAAGDEDLVQDESEIKSGETIEEKIKQNFFLTAELNKSECYVGEPLMALYKACSRLNASSQVVKRPSLTGFSVIEMVDNYDGKPVIENINGKAFYTHLIRKVQLFPLQAGNFELDAAQVESVIHFTKSESDDNVRSELQQLLSSPDDTQRTNTSFDHNVALTTAPLSIVVKPLPETNQPENFSGAVGEFFISTQMPEKNILQNEMATMRVTISGKGNLPLITAPAINWPSAIEASQPAVSEMTNKYFYPLSGTKTFEYSFLVKDTGMYTVPAVEFSYFNPSLKTYKTVKGNFDSFHVKEAPFKKHSKPMDLPVATPEPAFPQHLIWFGLLIAIICTWIIYQLVLLIKYKKQQRFREIQQQHEESLLSELSTPFKKDEFAKAEEALLSDDKKTFYLAIEMALWNAVAEKYNLLPSALNKQNVKLVLANKNVSPECITSFIAALNQCEWALYTTGVDEKDMQALLASARKITDDISASVCND